MNSNQKLSKTIGGLTIKNVAQNGSDLAIDFDDNSKMTVKTSGGNVNAADLQGLKISKVQQQDTTLRLIGADNKKVDVPLNEATSSVMVRDGNGGFAYSD